MIARDSTVLPEPDSPTIPSALPRSSENVTPSTARTRPRSVLKWVRRSVTSSSVPSDDSGRGLQPAHMAASRMSKCLATQLPIRLKASTVMNSITAGMMVAHQYWSMSTRASLIISPHDASGALML